MTKPAPFLAAYRAHRLEREAQVIHAGRSHTAGDTVVWLPKERVLFAGDTVEFGATPYCGDAHLADWPATLRAIRELGPEKLVPGRGRALLTRGDVEQGLADTEAFTGTLFARVASVAELKAAIDVALQQIGDGVQCHRDR